MEAVVLGVHRAGTKDMGVKETADENVYKTAGN